MTRRINELKKLWNYPDLIVIDGWKWQLSSVLKIIEKSLLIPSPGEENTLDANKIQIVSLAKQEEELFLPGISKSIVLSKDSPQLRLVQSIRDEAHRFAITFNRDARSANMKKNILESLPWIWPVTRKKIIRNFWSVGWLKAMSRSDIESKLWLKVTQILDDHWLLM